MSTPEFSPSVDALRNYELACQLAREGDAGVRSWFSRPVRAGADDYAAFLAGKAPAALAVGLRDIPCLSSHLFPIQRSVTEFTLRTGRAGVYLGTGLGKSVIQLEHSQHAAAATNGKALILAPLAVAMQFKREGDKHGYAVRVIRERSDVGDGINICNYDRIDKIDPDDFGSVCLDEASVLKDFSGKTTRALTDAFAAHRFRVVATATPAPNDHMELGTQSEFLGVLDYREMLSRWFVNDTATASQKWRLKGHAVSAFWDWVASWARMATLPSDLGYPDDGFILPPLKVIRHRVNAPKVKARPGELFAAPASATTMFAAKRQTAGARVDAVAEMVHAEPSEPWACWCDTNDESAALAARIPGAVEVRGSMRTEEKEDAIAAFCDGQARVLISKASICGWGLNLQHCARTAFVGRTFCFDEKTEILTKRGWLPFGAIDLNDDVSAVQPDTLKLVWEKPTDIIWERYSGKMVKFGGTRSFNLLVTPNHRMLVRECGVRHPSRDQSWHFRDAVDIANTWKRQDLRVPSIPSSWDGVYLNGVSIPEYQEESKRSCHSHRRNIVSKLSRDQVIRLAGWYLSEGHVRKNHHVVVISQTDNNKEYRNEIIDLLSSIGLRVNFRTKDMYVCSANLAEWLVSEFGRLSENMRIPRWMKDSDTEALVLLRDTMMKGDGAVTGRYYRSFSKQLQDDFQEICLKTGWKATVRPEWGGVMIGKEFLEPSLYNRPIIEHYDGMIGCVSVPSGAVLVRRNGQPIITGNSFESWHQAVRRFHRFGQTREVHVHVVVADSEQYADAAIQRKEADHTRMRAEMVAAMRRDRSRASSRMVGYDPKHKGALPAWLSA